MRDLALAGILVPLLAMAAARPFVGILVWSWISFMNPHQEVYGFAGSMPWAMLTFLVTVFGCVVAGEPRRLALNAVTVLLMLFGACITVTSILTIGDASQTWKMWDRVIKVLAGLLLTASLLTDRRRIDALVWLMVIAIGYYGVKGGIFTLVTGGGFIVLGPSNTMISDRNHLAVALLVTLPLMNYLRQHARHRIVRQGLMFAMGATLFAAIGSQSRGALLALGATAGMLWLRSRGKIVSGIAIVAAVAAVITFMPDSWVERMNTIQTFDQDASASARLRTWGTAWKLARLRPMTGGGFRAIYQQPIVDMLTPGWEAYAVHSIWLEALADHGFPTFIVWLGIIGAGIWYSLRLGRIARDRADLRWAVDLARMTQVSVASFAVGGTFLSLSYWDFFWTLMVIMGATHAVVRQALSQAEAQPAEVRGTGWRRAAGPMAAPYAGRRVA